MLSLPMMMISLLWHESSDCRDDSRATQADLRQSV